MSKLKSLFLILFLFLFVYCLIGCTSIEYGDFKYMRIGDFEVGNANVTFDPATKTYTVNISDAKSDGTSAGFNNAIAQSKLLIEAFKLGLSISSSPANAPVK